MHALRRLGQLGYSYNDHNRLSWVSLNSAEQAGYLYNFAGQQVVRAA